MFAVACVGLLQENPNVASQTFTRRQNSTTVPSAKKQDTDADLATIIQSGSTNTRPYKVVIHTDGSATAEMGGVKSALRAEPPRLQQFPPRTVDARTLQRLLSEIGDVSKIPTRNCPKSVSFGTRTEISYAGKTSGDLQCIRNDASGGDEANLQVSEELNKFVQATLRQMKMNGARRSSAR